MDNGQMKKVAIKAGIFGAVSLVVMFQRAATKHILITDAAGTHIDRASTADSYNILIDRNVGNGQSGKLIIPLSKTVSSDDIVLEERYIDHELRIYIDSREEGFYLDNAVVTDIDILKSAVCIAENDSGSVCLDFVLDGLYASSSSLTESSTIEVEFAKPNETYDGVVVVDPCANDIYGTDGAIDIAYELKEISAKDEENNLKIFFTDLSGKNVTEERKSEFVKEAQADLVVALNAMKKDDLNEVKVAAYYNSKYFLRRLNNAEFADMLERSTAEKLGAVAEGVYEAKEDDLLLHTAVIPAARLYVEYGAADDEKKAAEGIYNAILKAYEAVNK
ncbi:hypothetical protein SAMN04487928_12253 [Butyrivibrio proteoclasticus]|uniref:N-acetylmuramoyl-L-alanine amidase n=1 Tax=Butyrivibrio proteoclasticus TaxID=43305 RepID=A0A1I5WGS0_9FIRM|nr:hypothetical protein [Butyrivibrio proteoclasticus]SFQ18875.1 hypothetical protein SAMN04487928_12253 [Butyrivibrio proteoclasticus]